MDDDHARSGFDTGSPSGDMDDFLTNMDAFDATGPGADVFGLEDDEPGRDGGDDGGSGADAGTGDAGNGDAGDGENAAAGDPAAQEGDSRESGNDAESGANGGMPPEVKMEEDKSEEPDTGLNTEDNNGNDTMSSAAQQDGQSDKLSEQPEQRVQSEQPSQGVDAGADATNGDSEHKMDVDGEDSGATGASGASGSHAAGAPEQKSSTASGTATTTATVGPDRKPMAPQTTVTVIPSYAAWFSMDRISEIEKKSLPEFFSGRNQSKTPETYRGYRDFMINAYRLNAQEYLSVTACRRHLVGDVGAIMRVHQFLDRWGLINYEVQAEMRPIGVAPPYTGHWKTTLDTPRGLFPFQFYKGAEDPAAMLNQNPREPSEEARVNGGSGGVGPDSGVPSVDGPTATSFVKSEEGVASATLSQRSGWSKEETLKLLDAVEQHPQDWRAIAGAVGRSREECLARFVTLCSEDGFLDASSGGSGGGGSVGPLKYALNNIPFSQADNPVTSVVGFLASLVDARAVAAAANRSVAELKKQLAAGDRDSDDKPDNGGAEEPSVNGLAATAFASVAARSHVLQTHSERQMYGQFVGIVGQQLTKMDLKLERLAAIERALEQERRELEREREAAFVARVAAHRKAHAVEAVLRRALDEARAGSDAESRSSLDEAARMLAENTRLTTQPSGPEDGGGDTNTKSYDSLKPISSEMPTTHKYWSA